MKWIIFFLLLPLLSFGQQPANNFCGTYTTSAPISLNGVSGRTITGLSITATTGVPCINLVNCDHITIYNCILTGNTRPNQTINQSGVTAFNCHDVTIRNCFFQKTSRGVNFVSFTGATANLRADSCWFQDMTGPYPAGQAIQLNKINGAGCSASYNTIENLPGVSAPADAINFFQSNGTSTSNMVANHNWIRQSGTTAALISGGSILLGDGSGSYQSATSNISVNGGKFLFGVAGGQFMTIANNTGYLYDPAVSPNPVGVQAYNSVYPTSCGTITITGNRIYCKTAAGVLVPYFIPNPPALNACNPVSNFGNTWSDVTVTPAVLPATLIPTCVVSPPNLSYSPNAYTFYVNTTIPNINITNTGGACSSFTISPTQPNGLLFNSATAQISGVPLFVTPQTVYTVSGTNAGGQNATHITLTIIDNPPKISYTPNSQICTLGVPITPMLPSNGGGAGVSYTCTPSLPTGLNFNTSTGLIQGTPSVLSVSTVYTITSFNSGGSSPTTVTLTVNPPSPAIPNVNYSPNSYIFPINVAISPIVPNSIGGAVASWGISPSLPTGLLFSTSTGQITGTPTINSSITTYDVTTANVSGTAHTPLTLSVITVLPAPPSITYNPPSVAIQINQPSPILIPINTGGTAVGYVISPTLPTGMTINPSTGFISGTPTVLTPATQFTVTATNTGGSGTFPITISVVSPTPGQIIRVPGKNGVLVFPP